MSSNPPVVLVHGAWHGGWCWAHLQAELDRRGVASYAVDLPGRGASTLPLGDLYADADHVAAVVATVARHTGKDPILVGHSYGGAVITEAATRSLAAGVSVAHLLYLTAFTLDAGESLISLYSSMPPAETLLGSAVEPHDDASTQLIRDLAAAALYGCCDPLLVPAALDRLSPHLKQSFVQPATGAPRTTVPSTYVECLRDEGISPAHQHLMAQRCGTVLTLDTDHSPFLSKVAETADIVEAVVRSTGAIGASTRTGGAA